MYNSTAVLDACTHVTCLLALLHDLVKGSVLKDQIWTPTISSAIACQSRWRQRTTPSMMQKYGHERGIYLVARFPLTERTLKAGSKMYETSF